MPTLGIFTVKYFAWHQGEYYTCGGFGAYLREIRKRFEKVILVAHVAHAPPGAGFYPISMEGLEMVALPPIRNELFSLLTLPIQFWRCLAAAPRMDVAHARMPDYTGAIGALACRLRGVPCFHQIVDDWSLLARSTPASKKFGLGLFLKAHLYFYDLIERLICRKQLVFAQGQTCYEKHRRNANCQLVISSSHLVNDVISSHDRFQGAHFTILNVARFNAVKNQELLLRALVNLNRETDRWRLVLVGDGVRQSMLKELAAELRVAPWVSFPGNIAHGADLWNYFDKADVFALSSRSEGTPKVVLEAMCRGLPVVGSAVSGVPTMIQNGVRGLLFPDNDLEALVEALRRMAFEPVLRQRCVENGRNFALEECIENVTSRMVKQVFERWPALSTSKIADANEM